MDPVEVSDGTGAYPSSWETDVVLSDGHTVHVRPIVPTDASLLERFHERQSPESIYLRYFSPRPRLSARDVAHLTTVDHRDRVAFVALAGGEMIGVARYERYRGTDTAEVAFFVDDAHRGRGLASLLLEYLAAAAIDNGIRRFAASTLPSNRRMLAVFQGAGYDVASRLDDGVVEVSFDIDPTGASVATMDRRERAAEAASVRPMLRPRSVAVIGAGRDGRGLGGQIFRNLLADGFTGPMYPVNHGADEVAGVPAVRAVADLPDGIDLAVIATPAAGVAELIEQCGAKGVRSVVVVSAGFSESGPQGSAHERTVVEVARSHGLRLLGPNCLGLINTDPTIRLNATLAPGLPVAGGVAMMAEAGTLSASILEHAQRMQLGLSTMVAAGNRADVSSSDLLSYWVEDDDTRAVLLYLAARTLEPRFVRAARAASLHKPVAALHTSMAGRGNRADMSDVRRRSHAMFRQTGVIGVGTLEQLFDLGRILADQPAPAGPGVAIVGNSDGAVALTADACVQAGLSLVGLAGSDAAGAPLRNPVDLTHEAGAAAFAEALRAVASDPQVHSVIVIYTPPRLDWDEDVVRVILDAARTHPEVTFTATMLGAAGRSRLWLDEAPDVEGDAGAAVPIFRFPEDAASALGRLAGYRAWRDAALAGAHEPPPGPPPDAAIEVARDALARLGADGSRRSDLAVLDHHEQARLLEAYGVAVLDRRIVADVDDAVDAARELGWPVALKAARRNRLTRSAASGVVLDIADEASLRSTWARMAAVLDDGMTPTVVQRFIDSGIDFSIAVERDETGSGTIEVGLGGPAAIMGESELAVLPLTLSDASALVASSAAGRVLPDPLDRVPLVELVHRLSVLAVELDELRSLRADPIVTSPIAACIADVDVELGAPIEDFTVRRLD